MHSNGIPEEVLRFITANIDTVPQLEALLLMWENPARGWECEQLSERIYVRSDVCAEILHALQRRGLVVVSDDARLFRYSEAWDRSGQFMAQIAAAYRRNLVQIATFIHSKGPAAVRDFARAFNLKKER